MNFKQYETLLAAIKSNDKTLIDSAFSECRKLTGDGFVSLSEGDKDNILSKLQNILNIDEKTAWENLQTKYPKATRYGLDEGLNAYIKILAYTSLASSLEGFEESELFAYRLAKAYGNANDAFQYLETCPVTERPTYHACHLIDIPDVSESEQTLGLGWDIETVHLFCKNYMSDSKFNMTILPKIMDLQQKLLKEGKIYIPSNDERRQIEEDLKVLNQQLSDIIDIVKTLNQSIQKIKKRIKEKNEKISRSTSDDKELKEESENLEKDLASIVKQLEEINVERKKIESKTRDKKQEIRNKAKKLNKTLFEDMSLNQLYTDAVSIVYKRAGEASTTAATDSAFYLSEAQFDRYLDLLKKQQETVHTVPSFFFDGSSIGINLAVQKLSSKDSKGSYLGHITGCCQSFDGAADSAVEHGILHGNNFGIIYMPAKEVVSSKKSKQQEGTKPQPKTEHQPVPDTQTIKPTDIFAQFWCNVIGKGTPKETWVFDSLEMQPVKKNSPRDLGNIIKMCTAIAYEISQKHKVDVHIGKNDFNLGYKDLSSEEFALLEDKEVYSDADDFQTLLASKDYPIYALAVFNPEKALEEFNKKENAEKYDKHILMLQIASSGNFELLAKLIDSMNEMESEEFLIKKQGFAKIFRRFTKMGGNAALITEKFPALTKKILTDMKSFDLVFFELFITSGVLNLLSRAELINLIKASMIDDLNYFKVLVKLDVLDNAHLNEKEKDEIFNDPSLPNTVLERQISKTYSLRLSQADTDAIKMLIKYGAKDIRNNLFQKAMEFENNRFKWITFMANEESIPEKYLKAEMLDFLFTLELIKFNKSMLSYPNMPSYVQKYLKDLEKNLYTKENGPLLTMLTYGLEDGVEYEWIKASDHFYLEESFANEWINKPEKPEWGGKKPLFVAVLDKNSDLYLQMLLKSGALATLTRPELIDLLKTSLYTGHYGLSCFKLLVKEKVFDNANLSEEEKNYIFNDLNLPNTAIEHILGLGMNPEDRMELINSCIQYGAKDMRNNLTQKALGNDYANIDMLELLLQAGLITYKDILPFQAKYGLDEFMSGFEKIGYKNDLRNDPEHASVSPVLQFSQASSEKPKPPVTENTSIAGASLQPSR